MKSDRIYLSRSLPIVRDRSLLKIARVAVLDKIFYNVVKSFYSGHTQIVTFSLKTQFNAV